MAREPRFTLGVREVSESARQALSRANVDPERLFERHGSGDWGVIEAWCARDNDRAAARSRASHAISSRYVLDDDIDVKIVSSMDRSRTRLQLTSEYRNIDVSSTEGYALWADTYDVANPLVETEQRAVQPILDGLGSVGTVVDVGTGTGRHALLLARHSRMTVGIDESAHMLGVARSNASEAADPSPYWIEASVGVDPLPLRSSVADLVISALMLTHVTDLAAAVSECARIVRTGGTVLITDLHPAVRWVGWRTSFGTPDAWVSLPNAPHTRKNYLDALDRAGCRVTLVRDIAPDGTDYGEVSEARVRTRGDPPLCLLVVAERR